MAEKVKITQKELKKPDKFREAIADAIVLASENYKKILAVFGAVILILIVVFVIMAVLERRKMSANLAFTEAMKIYTGASSGRNSQEALNKFLDVSKKYPHSGVSNVALYYAAEINYNMGKYDEAIKLLNDLIKSGSKKQIVVDAAYLRLGTASFNKGNWQQSIDYLSKLDKEGNPYRDQAELYIAQSLGKLGKSGEAEKMYRQILSGSEDNMRLQIQKKLESIKNNTGSPTE
jgi:TolA-binding protein